MPRPPRIEIDGGVYHVYNRISSGEDVFLDGAVANDFVRRLHRVKKRSGWTVFAWCLMSNHYHLAVRTSNVPLHQSLHILQGQFSKHFNRDRGRTGGLWQSRYHARLVGEQRYLSQLVLYIHLNPIRAGVADDPGAYPYSGHEEIVGRVRRPLTDIDEALLCFDETRRSALRAYRSSMRIGTEEVLGRESGTDPEEETDGWKSAPGADEQLKSRSSSAAGEADHVPFDRPSAHDLLTVACRLLSADVDRINGKDRDRPTSELRRLIASVLSEQWQIPRKELAAALERNPEIVSHWTREARLRREEDQQFRRRLIDFHDRLVEAYSGEGGAE